MSTHPARILVADNADGFEVFRDALAGNYRLAWADTVEAARDALAQSPALVVCGCHFDEGRMYDLLRHMKATPAHEKTPFLAIRCTEGELLDDALYESVKIAVRALGGNAFVDLRRWERRWGKAQADSRLAHLVDTLVQAPPPDTA